MVSDRFLDLVEDGFDLPIRSETGREAVATTAQLGGERPDIRVAARSHADFDPAIVVNFGDDRHVCLRRQSDEVDLRYITLDGREIDIESAVSRIVWDNRDAFMVIAHDVTARKQAERAFREQEAQMRLVIDTLPALVCYVDSDCVIRFANKPYGDRHGRRVEDLIGKTLDEVWAGSGDDRSEIRDSIARTLKGEISHTEREVVKDGGETHIHFTTRAPHFGPDGTVTGPEEHAGV